MKRAITGNGGNIIGLENMYYKSIMAVKMIASNVKKNK